MRTRSFRIASAVTVVALLWATLWSEALVQTTNGTRACAVGAPIKRVEAKQWYTDSAGSLIDKTSLQEHLALIRPVREYATTLSLAVDRLDFNCADRLLITWAQGDALMQRPTNFAGLREQMRFAMAITLSAARVKAQARPMPDNVLKWLSKLNVSIADEFRRRAVYDNLYVWSGTTAAIAYAVTRDRSLLSFADEVWERARNSIAVDGTLNTELRRGSRALFYHVYYLAGLMLLGETLGREMPDEVTNRLYRFVRYQTCPGGVPVVRLPQQQERPNQGDLALIGVLGGAKLAPPLCAELPSRVYDPLRGGDLRRLHEIMSRLNE